MSQAFYFFMGNACPPPGIRLWDQVSGWLLATAPLPVDPLTAFSFDLAALELAEGDHELGVSAVNVYGCESARATVDVLIGAGGEVALDFIDPTEVVAEALAGGVVAVSWSAVVDLTSEATQTTPAEFEVAEASDLGTILATVGWNGARVFRSELAFADALEVTLAVRSSDGVVAGLRGPWVEAAVVVADASGPAVPVIDLGAVSQACDC